MNSNLVKLAPFTRLSDRVWRVLGLNPGKFTLQVRPVLNIYPLVKQRGMLLTHSFRAPIRTSLARAHAKFYWTVERAALTTFHSSKPLSNPSPLTPTFPMSSLAMATWITLVD